MNPEDIMMRNQELVVENEKLRKERDEAVALKNAALVSVGSATEDYLYYRGQRDDARKIAALEYAKNFNGEEKDSRVKEFYSSMKWEMSDSLFSSLASRLFSDSSKESKG